MRVTTKTNWIEFDGTEDTLPEFQNYCLIGEFNGIYINVMNIICEVYYDEDEEVYMAVPIYGEDFKIEEGYYWADSGLMCYC